MPAPQDSNRTVAFFDGQNLFRHAKSAFGHYHPNYDPLKLTDAVCSALDLRRHLVIFYTGYPKYDRDPDWHNYWSNRFKSLSRAGIRVVKRTLSYHSELVQVSGGTSEPTTVAREKGIDVRISLDLFRMAVNDEYDSAIIFSQDQDLAEAVRDVKRHAENTHRRIKLYSAYPVGPNASSSHHIRGTIPFKMDESFYNACLDSRDYRPSNWGRS